MLLEAPLVAVELHVVARRFCTARPPRLSGPQSGAALSLLVHPFPMDIREPQLCIPDLSSTQTNPAHFAVVEFAEHLA